MTLKHYYNGTLLTTAVLLADEKGFSSRASIGQVDTSTVYVDDPDGTYDFVGYKTWKMVEDACPIGSQVVWHGYVGDQTISRMAGSAGYQLGVSRRWEIELIEDNGWPSRQVIISPAANRPSETVSARITWVLTMRGMTGIVWNHGLVEASTTVMEANDYQYRTAKAVLDDCSTITGWNWFLRYNELYDHIELIFHDPNSANDPALLTISNVAADINLTTVWPPSMDAQQKFGASRIASGLLLPFDGGTDYDQDPATAVLFGTVDQVAPTSAVKTKTAARTQITRLLAQHNEQDMSVENVVLQLPAANLNDVKHGQRISSVRLSHGRGGITSGISMRVRSKAFSRPENDTQAVYDVALSLTPAKCVPAALQQGELLTPGGAHGNDFLMPFTPAAGSFLLAYIGYRDLAWVTLPGWTLHDQRGGGGSKTGWVWKIADGTEQYFNTTYASGKYGYVYAFSCASGASSLTSTFTSGSGSQMTCASVTAPGAGLVLGGFGVGIALPGVDSADHRAGGAYPAVVPGTGYTLDWTGQEQFHPMMSIIIKSISAAGAHTPSGFKDKDLAPWVYNSDPPGWHAWAIAVTAAP